MVWINLKKSRWLRCWLVKNCLCNYATKIVNAYIVYELETWPKAPLNNFKFKNCLSGATNIVKNSDK